MTRLIRSIARGPVLPALLVLLGACGGEPELVTERVVLSGTVDVPGGAGTDAVVHVNLYHAWALEGELRHPLAEIESFEAGVGDYSYEFDYPVEKGEGLVVYAWVDLDGDGMHCTPTVRVDRAGLTEVAGFTPGAVSADVTLIAPCAGPEWFFPAAE